MNTENKPQTAADYWINNCLEIYETDIGLYYMSRENFLMSMEQFAAQQTVRLQVEYNFDIERRFKQELDKTLELLNECKLELEYLNKEFPPADTTNSLLLKIEKFLGY